MSCIIPAMGMGKENQLGGLVDCSFGPLDFS